MQHLIPYFSNTLYVSVVFSSYFWTKWTKFCLRASPIATPRKKSLKIDPVRGTSRLVVSVIAALSALIPRHGSDLRGLELSAGRPHEHTLLGPSSFPSLFSLSLFVPEFNWNVVFGGDRWSPFALSVRWERSVRDISKKGYYTSQKSVHFENCISKNKIDSLIRISHSVIFL